MDSLQIIKFDSDYYVKDNLRLFRAGLEPEVVLKTTVMQSNIREYRGSIDHLKVSILKGKKYLFFADNISFCSRKKSFLYYTDSNLNLTKVNKLDTTFVYDFQVENDLIYILDKNDLVIINFNGDTKSKIELNESNTTCSKLGFLNDDICYILREKNITVCSIKSKKQKTIEFSKSGSYSKKSHYYDKNSSLLYMMGDYTLGVLKIMNISNIDEFKFENIFEECKYASKFALVQFSSYQTPLVFISFIHNSKCYIKSKYFSADENSFIEFWGNVKVPFSNQVSAFSMINHENELIFCDNNGEIIIYRLWKDEEIITI